MDLFETFFNQDIANILNESGYMFYFFGIIVLCQFTAAFIFYIVLGSGRTTPWVWFFLGFIAYVLSVIFNSYLLSNELADEELFGLDVIIRTSLHSFYIAAFVYLIFSAVLQLFSTNASRKPFKMFK